MVSSFLVSTAATGAVLLGVAVFIRGLRQWRHDKPGVESSDMDALAAMFRSPRTWMVSYVVLILVATGGVYVALGGAGVPESLANAGLTILGVVFGLVVLAFVAVATYAAVRGKGRPSAQAAGMSATAVGFMLLAAVATKLLLGG